MPKYQLNALAVNLSDLCKADLNRCLTSKEINIDGSCLLTKIHPLNNSGSILPNSRYNCDLIANTEINRNCICLDSKRLNLSICKRNRLASGSYETGNATCITNNVPSLIIHIHIDKNVSGEHLPLNILTNTILNLNNILKRNPYLENLILKVISIVIVPIGAAVFYKQYFIVHNTIRDAVVNTVASVLGMIPEGLVLLTSVALTVGTVHLARKKVLVQELFCIETLAHVDVLCLDKTGTITSGDMCVDRIIPLESTEAVTVRDGNLEAPTLSVPDVKTIVPPPHPDVVQDAQEDTAVMTAEELPAEIADAMGNLMNVSPDENPTALALRKFVKCHGA